MAIANYQQPQTSITLNFLDEPSNVVLERYPFLVGPNYHVESPDLTTAEGAAFDAAGQELLFQRLIDGLPADKPTAWQADPAFTKLYVRDGELQLAQLLSAHANKVRINSASESNVLRLLNASWAGTNRDSRFDGRDTEIGDLVSVNDGQATVKRRVLALRGVTIPASFGSNVAADDGFAGFSILNPADQGSQSVTAIDFPGSFTLASSAGTYAAAELGPRVDGYYGDEYILTATTGGAAGTSVFDITTASGYYSATSVASTSGAGSVHAITHAALRGLTLNISAGSITQGQVFRVRVRAAYSRNPEDYVLIAGTYTGPRNTVIQAQVLVGVKGAGGNEFTGATVRISDTEGLITPFTTTVTTDTAIALGYGLTLTFDNSTLPDHASLVAGEVFWVSVKAATESSTSFDKIVLDGPAVNMLYFSAGSDIPEVNLRMPYSGYVAADSALSGTAWTQDSVGVTVESGLSVSLVTRSTSPWVPFVGGEGELLLVWRALIPPTVDERPIKINGAGDVATHLGAATLNNPLAYGAIEALGSGGLPCYVVRVSSDDVLGYQSAFAKVERLDTVLAIAALSDDAAVHAALKASVAASGAPTKQRWRGGYVGTTSPGRWLRLKYRSDGVSQVTATILPYAGLGNVLVTLDPSGQTNLTTLGLRAGDTLRLPATGAEYTIEQVLNSNELLLESPGTIAPVSPAVAIELWAADTAENEAAYVKARSSALASKDVMHLWHGRSTKVLSGVTTVIPGWVSAAYAVGLRAKLPAQQGMTRQVWGAVGDASDMFNRFGDELLNEIAAAGTAIITQDSEGGEVYLRHQLTTDATDNLLTAEDNLKYIGFRVGYAWKTITKNYIGRRNVTTETLARLQDEIDKDLAQRTRTERASGDIGPEIVGYGNLSVIQHPTMKAHIIVRGKIDVATPINGITATLDIAISASVA